MAPPCLWARELSLAFDWATLRSWGTLPCRTGELLGWQGSFIILIGVYQLIYVVPAFVVLSVLHQRNAARGLLLGAVVTALLNAGCFLVVRYAP